MGQTASSHNDAPPPPSIPLTPRCGRAVRQVNDVLERGGWRVFESCDDDFTGVVSLEEIRAKFVEVLRSSTTASSLSLPALNAFLACCDRGDGFVDHGGWNVLRENVARIAKRETVEAPPGHPQGAMVVLPPGALVREGVQRDAPRKAKLKTGTQLLDNGRRRGAGRRHASNASDVVPGRRRLRRLGLVEELRAARSPPASRARRRSCSTPSSWRRVDGVEAMIQPRRRRAATI